MIQQLVYPQAEKGLYNTQCDDIIESDSGFDSILQMSNELKSSVRQQNNEPRIIKQLKSKHSWMKYVHKKIPFFPNKCNHRIKKIFSLSSQKPSITDDNIIQSEVILNSDTKQPNNHNKICTPQNNKEKQKFIEPSSIFNPQLFTFSREQMNLSRQKYNKKIKVSQISNLQHRVRQSRSQSKGEKVIQHQNITKSTLNTYDNHSNIFQNLQLLAKHNSYHSLDKNQAASLNRGSNTLVHSKVQEKLHLPSLTRISQLKNKNKGQAISLLNQIYQTELQKSPFYHQNTSKTQKSSPFIQKIIKIPIDRLKPLRPQEIKLKFQQKVKQEQKNRAKYRAIQIFEKQEKQSSIKKQKLNLGYQSESEQSAIIKTESKKKNHEKIDKVRSKNSVHHKRQKQSSTSKVQNIFKNIDFRQKLV